MGRGRVSSGGVPLQRKCKLLAEKVKFDACFCHSFVQFCYLLTTQDADMFMCFHEL